MRKFFLLACIFFLAGCGGGGGDDDPGTTFYAVDFNASTSGAPVFYQLQATKAAEGDHCYVYVEKGRGVSDSDLRNIVATFDNSVYPKVVSHFGSEPDVDGDPKIFILLMDIRGEATDGLGDVTSYVAGYFFAWNEIPELANSNGKEIFFMDIKEGDPSRPQFYDTLAHEFQHMIHWNLKWDDDTWLDEAMSEIAPFYAGLGVSWSRVFGFEQENNRSDSLTVWNDQLADYYVAYMWAQYMADRFPETAFKSILALDNTGVASVEEYLKTRPSSPTFSAVFRDWSIAVFSGWNTALTDNSTWVYRSIDTWPGTHDGYDLPGMFTWDNFGIADLPALGPWSIDLYWYDNVSTSLKWDRLPSSALQASFYNYNLDPSGQLTFDMVSGTTYPFDNAAVLILQNAGDNTAAGSTAAPAANLSPARAPAGSPAAGPSPAEKLRAVSASRATKALKAATGRPTPVCMHRFLSLRTREAITRMREGGNAP